MAVTTAYTSNPPSSSSLLTTASSLAFPGLAQPIVLGPADSFPSPMTIRSLPSSMHSPTAMYLNMPDEDFLGFAEKRKRDDSQDDSDYVAKFAHINSPFSDSSPDEEDIANLEEYLSRRPGRKPMADEDCLSQDMEHDARTKRKAQNRAAQRAFRERKERYVKELETKIKHIQDSHNQATAQLVQENQHLRSIIYRLEAENFALKGIHMQFPIQPSPYYLFTPPATNTAAAAAVTSTSNNSNPPSILSRMHAPLLAPGPPPPPPPPSSMPQQQQQQQQYTFSISTPATLRPKKSQKEQFIEGVEGRVSNNAIEQLLSEPLFDTTGGLIRRLEDNETTSSSFLTCPEIWERLAKHDQFSLFTTQELCQEVGRRARPTERHGPILDEPDMEAILKWMSSKAS